MLMNELTTEKIDDLKKLIRSQLESDNVFPKIRKIINTNSSLQETGILEKIINSLSSNKKTAIINSSSNSSSNNSDYLFIKLVGGKGFIGYDNGMLGVSISYGRQRFEGKKVNADENPKFDDEFLINLGENDGGLINLNEKIKIIVVDQNKDLVGCHLLEWRKVLKKPGILGVSVEIGEDNISKGILEFRMEILQVEKMFYKEEGINKQIMNERRLVKKEKSAFFLYAQKWYQEFLQIDTKNNKNRLIKIFTNNEFGQTVPVCSYIKKIRCRYLDNINLIKRFVSLIELEKVNFRSKEVWATMSTFLSCKKGSTSNHAILLENLLLGLGYDSYVCCGYVSNDDDQKISGGELKGYIWILIKYFDNSVKFIDPLSGWTVSTRKNSKFKTVDCCFNDKRLFANIQNPNDVGNCSFEFKNSKYWKKLEYSSNIEKVSDIKLFPPNPNPVQLEIDIENQIKRRIHNYRKQLHLSTKWNRDLSFILSQYITCLENEKLFGKRSKTIENDFHDCIKRNVKEGFIFKAFPIDITSTNVNEIMNLLNRNEVSEEILQTNGNNISFGLRIKIYSLPEGINHLYLFICVTFMNIK